ncbi:hypothetical protein OBBRIDRAFT_808701, partial [Obba rivulosa]
MPEPQQQPALLDDPNLAKCPDYGAVEYAELRAIVAQQRQSDDEGAIQYLRNLWTAKNNADKNRWADQLLAQDIQQNNRPDQQQRAPSQAPELQEPNDENVEEQGHPMGEVQGESDDEPDFTPGTM